MSFDNLTTLELKVMSFEGLVGDVLTTSELKV